MSSSSSRSLANTRAGFFPLADGTLVLCWLGEGGIPAGLVGVERNKMQKCVKMDSGSAVPVDIDPSLINDRHAVNPPANALSWTVMDDAVNPGQFLLVGWSYQPPITVPPAAQ